MNVPQLPVAPPYVIVCDGDLWSHKPEPTLRVLPRIAGTPIQGVFRQRKGSIALRGAGQVKDHWLSRDPRRGRMPSLVEQVLIAASTGD